MDVEYVHKPVLTAEILELLAGNFLMHGNTTLEDTLLLDCTLGEGGHSEEFLRHFSNLRIIGIDADKKILEKAQNRLAAFEKRIVFYNGWSHEFFQLYKKNAALPRPDMILMDLGVSLYHYEKSGRGFSFAKDETLDMRIDTTQGVDAAFLLRTLSEKELAGILQNNTEERYSRRIARAIVRERSKSPITTSARLAALVERTVPFPARRNKIHPATKTFAALRVEVNGELARLAALLEDAFRALKTGGRMGVITFHSLEDRIVKNFFKEKSLSCVCPPSAAKCTCRGKRLARLINKKPLCANAKELQENPASRSAKLRIIEKEQP